MAEVEEEVEGCRRTWHPVPMYAQKTDGIGGSRKTSPCTSFQPLSSSSSSSSSARAYREKSFLSTRIRMIERKPAAAAGGGGGGVRRRRRRGPWCAASAVCVCVRSETRARRRTGEEEDEDEAVDDRQPVDLEALRQERVLRVPVHPLGERHVGREPLDRVGELDVPRRLLAEVDSLQRVGRHVDLDHAVVVVRDREVEVREEEVPAARGGALSATPRGGIARGAEELRAARRNCAARRAHRVELSYSRSKLTDLVSSSPT